MIIRCLSFAAFLALALLQVSTAQAQAAASNSYRGLFDVEARRAQLQDDRLSSIRDACLAWDAEADWLEAPVIDGLRETSGYGTDRAAQDFSWRMMVLSARALAGDRKAEDMLVAILRKWANQGGFDKTEKVHDAYYALKRAMLPAVVAFSVVQGLMADNDRALVRDWLDRNVRRVDELFYGDVDLNNHRYLADSVLAVWGGVIDDEDLVRKGLDRFATVLKDARWDGSLPLETRRGSRASWYMRQSLASMVVIAEVSRGRGEDLYSLSVQEPAGAENAGSDALAPRSFWNIMAYWLNSMISAPLLNAYAAANYIPGPEPDFMRQDYEYLDVRGHDRHYLAFLEAIPQTDATGLTARRAKSLLDREVVQERPLIDEFIGGNATCFWGMPQ